MLAVGGAAAVVSLVAAFLFLSRRGIVRWLSLAVFVLAPVAVIVVFAFRGVLWVAIASAAAWLLASVAARVALAGDRTDWRMPEHPAEPPARHPYLIMNPKSGGGKVGKFDLQTQGGRPWRRGVSHRRARARRRRPGGPRGRGPGRRSARRRRGRRHAGPGGRRRGRAWPAVRGDHRGHAQSFRPGSRAGPGGPVGLPGRLVRWCRAAGRPRDDQRPGLRQQRVVRRVRRGRRDPGLPGRQAEDDAGPAPGPAARPPRRAAVRAGGRRRRSGRRRRCWWPTIRTEPGTSPA